MLSRLRRGIVGALLRHQRRKKLATAVGSQRSFYIPPLFGLRHTDIDGLNVNGESQKLFEIRTYTVHPKDYNEYIKFTKDNFQLCTRYSKLFGCWTTELGALNETVYIWEYDNNYHRAKVQQDLARDSEWQTSYKEKVSPMFISHTKATLMLIPWSIITRPSSSGLYELKIFHMNSQIDRWEGRLKAAMEFSALKLKSFNSVLIACFISISGFHNIVYVLWQHESFDTFTLGKLQLLKEPNQSILNAFYREVLTAYSKGLLPHNFSPLQ